MRFGLHFENGRRRAAMSAILDWIAVVDRHTTHPEDREFVERSCATPVCDPAIGRLPKSVCLKGRG